MSNELKKLETAQQALSDAKEINAAEALTMAQSSQASIDIGMYLGRIQMAQ
ncbi:MarR family transcriptional regulator, partial [Vibrio parahaemolyticus]